MADEQVDEKRTAVKAALRALGIRQFLLGIHDPAFPSLAEEDIGRGTPYSRGASGFISFISELGFNGLQLGPQGITTPVNPSPYDGTLFSKNPLSLAPFQLIGAPWNLLSPDQVKLPVNSSLAVDRVNNRAARKIIKQVTEQICRNYLGEGEEKCGNISTRIKRSFDIFRQDNSSWLERDALYEILRKYYGGSNWQQWRKGDKAWLDRHLFAQPLTGRTEAALRIDSLHECYGEEIEGYKFIQFLLSQQHQAFRERCRSMDLKLYGDCQIGLSSRDSWYGRSFILRNYVMGAPPSRTNPEGQPWNYSVLDPRQYYQDRGKRYHKPGAAVRFFKERVDKLFEEFDGLRLDHPHGLVCPWVYRRGQKNPVKAVQEGARLFASPDLIDHPELADLAIPRPDQIDRRQTRYDDSWVRDLDPDQVNRYGVLIDIVMDSARRHGRSPGDIACEILSTQPYPIKRVMELYGLGRFRVTQKADLNNPSDVYRSENAHPEDWVMIGNHDTPTLWQKAAEWIDSGASLQQAAYLAERLSIPDQDRASWVERTAADAGELAQAKFADLFVGPARNILVFYTDLLGVEEPYNKPGTVNRHNWSLRIPPDYRKRYLNGLQKKRVLDIPRALAQALRARGPECSSRHRDLMAVLEPCSRIADNHFRN